MSEQEDKLIGKKGVIACPITGKDEKATLKSINMLWLLYTASGYYSCDIKCEGCGKVHRMYNPRFVLKPIETLEASK